MLSFFGCNIINQLWFDSVWTNSVIEKLSMSKENFQFYVKSFYYIFFFNIYLIKKNLMKNLENRKSFLIRWKFHSWESFRVKLSLGLNFLSHLNLTQLRNCFRSLLRTSNSNEKINLIKICIFSPSTKSTHTSCLTFIQKFFSGHFESSI
jgi:hypothetical protein